MIVMFFFHVFLFPSLLQITNFCSFTSFYHDWIYTHMQKTRTWLIENEKHWVTAYHCNDQLSTVSSLRSYCAAFQIDDRIDEFSLIQHKCTVIIFNHISSPRNAQNGEWKNQEIYIFYYMCEFHTLLWNLIFSVAPCISCK